MSVSFMISYWFQADERGMATEYNSYQTKMLYGLVLTAVFGSFKCGTGFFNKTHDLRSIFFYF